MNTNNPINQGAKNLTGTIWKMGINWGGRQNASHYSYVKSRNIVLGMDKQKYSIGDLVLITDGFKVKAIVRINGAPRKLKSDPEYSELFEKYGVHYEDWVTYASGQWLELERDEIFEYRSQRGAGKVNLDSVRDKAFSLWGLAFSSSM